MLDPALNEFVIIFQTFQVNQKLFVLVLKFIDFEIDVFMGVKLDLTLNLGHHRFDLVKLISDVPELIVLRVC